MPHLERQAGMQLLVMLLTSILAATPVSAASADTLDQQWSGDGIGGENECLDGPCATLAQTFTPGITGSLDRISLELSLANGSPGPLEVQIRETVGGVPTNNVLASTSVPQSSIPLAITWVSVPLPSPAPIIAGNVYAIVVGPVGTNSSNNYFWFVCCGGGNSAGYSGGAPFISHDGGKSWTPQPFVPSYSDYTFRTFVERISYAQLCAWGRRFVTSAAIASGMCTVLNAAQLNERLGLGQGKAAELSAYAQLVTAAQRTNSLSAEHAAVLLGLAATL